MIDRMVVRTPADLRAVLLVPPFEPSAVAIRVTPAATRQVPTLSGRSEVREVMLEVDGVRSEALLRADLPLKADGWFELLE